jgi:hypothetical protein
VGDTVAVFKAMYVSDDGRISLADVIEHQGMPWLVPMWLDNLGSPTTRPARMILLANLPHQFLGAQMKVQQYVVNDPLPSALFDVETPWTQDSKYVVLDRPDLEFRLPFEEN